MLREVKMELNFGVSSLIWSENFGKNDLHLFEKAKKIGFQTFDIAIFDTTDFPAAEVKKAAEDAGIELVTISVAGLEANPISPDPTVRQKAVDHLKSLIDVNVGIGSKIIGGPNYAAWSYITGRPRTDDEWKWSVDTIRKAAEYAKQQGNVVFALEPLNRFETFFLNIAEDAVKFCQDVGLDNVGVHLDCFHMIREETCFTEAVKTCGKKHLNFIHVCENNRGIPGTGLVPWKEFFIALKDIGYEGALSIESFDPRFEEFNKSCAIWRKFADSGEELATKGLQNLKTIAAEI